MAEYRMFPVAEHSVMNSFLLLASENIENLRRHSPIISGEAHAALRYGKIDNTDIVNV